MEISKVKDLKKALEENIKESLIQFENETGCSISSIDISNIRTSSGNKLLDKFLITRVNIVAEL